MTFAQCAICSSVVEKDCAPEWFSEETYKLFCSSCGIVACPGCAAKSFCEDSAACMRCDRARWTAELRFGVSYFFAIRNRTRQPVVHHMTSPRTFRSHVAALEFAVSDELRRLLVGMVDQTNSILLCNSAVNAFESGRAGIECVNDARTAGRGALDFKVLQRPDAMLHVAPVASPEFEISLTLTSFPIRVKNEL